MNTKKCTKCPFGLPAPFSCKKAGKIVYEMEEIIKNSKSKEDNWALLYDNLKEDSEDCEYKLNEYNGVVHCIKNDDIIDPIFGSPNYVHIHGDSLPTEGVPGYEHNSEIASTYGDNSRLGDPSGLSYFGNNL